MTIGARISEYRRQRNITQERLAEAMGVTSQAVSKWENDISCPDISVMPQLADYFGISLDRLMRGDEPNRPQVLPESARSDINSKVLRVLVDSKDGDKVKINLPMGLIIAGLDIGASLNNINFGNNEATGDIMKQIDLSNIIKLVENGMIGHLLEIEGANGDRVSIFVE